MTAETAEDSSLLELSEENERLTEDTCSVERNTWKKRGINEHSHERRGTFDRGRLLYSEAGRESKRE